MAGWTENVARSAHDRTRALDPDSDVALHLSGAERRDRERHAILHTLRQAMHSKRQVFGHDIQDPAHVFAAFDTDGSGSVSPDELSQALKRLRLGLSEEQIGRLAAFLGVDGDGDIDYGELLGFLRGEGGNAAAGAENHSTGTMDSEEADLVERIERIAETFGHLRETMQQTFGAAREFLDFVSSWAVVEVTKLADTVTAHREIELHVQRTLGLEGLGMCSIKMDFANRRAWLLCPRGAALRLMQALGDNSMDCHLCTGYPREMGEMGALPPRPPSVLCYKLVARKGGKFVSIYDGETEYSLGQTVSQPARPAHHGGFYVFRTAEQALDATFPASSALKDATKALLLVEAGDSCFEYQGGKVACSSITPIEVVLRRVKKAAWKV